MKNNFIHKINLAKRIANHIVGEAHTDKHRRIIGACIMVVSVVVTKAVTLISSNLFIGISIESIGLGLHGIGLIPFISSIEKLSKNQN